MGEDKVVLENAIFTGLAVFYDAATAALRFDPNGPGAAAAVMFATRDNLPASLSPSDFLVI